MNVLQIPENHSSARTNIGNSLIRQKAYEYKTISLLFQTTGG